ncbi:MAG TPA: GYD domain-containing protein [Armatimonadota bacterium]|nr:GYD domain-containing protein [Armatimonadota bacterium]
MATFVMFGKYSAEAMKGLSKDRTAEAAALVAKYGGEIKAAYALLGKTDLLLIADFPGTAEAMKASLALTKLTGIGFTTSPAITIEELDKLIGEL